MNEKQLQLVTFEQAMALKELGFDWKCYAYYEELYRRNTNIDKLDMNNDLTNEYRFFYSAPTVALALKWCRDEKEIENGLIPKRFCDLCRYCWWYNSGSELIGTSDPKQHETAESALLDEIIKYLKSEICIDMK